MDDLRKVSPFIYTNFNLIFSSLRPQPRVRQLPAAEAPLVAAQLPGPGGRGGGGGAGGGAGGGGPAQDHQWSGVQEGRLALASMCNVHDSN